MPATDEALRELRAKKELVGDGLAREGLSPGELSRLSAEFRMLVLAILNLEGRRPVEWAPQTPSKADELRARRDARRAEYLQAKEGE